ncbi:MAG: hypothetical protein ABFR95_03170 [Actinomycetota bacterium]
MDIEIIVERLRRTVEDQMRIAGDDPAMTAASDAVLSAIGPALRDAAFGFAEQAAAEISSQLRDRSVDVVVQDGMPSLVVRNTREEVRVSTEDLDARMTVRLPEDLKDDLEDAASELGDSVNTFVVKALSSSAKSRKRSSSTTFTGTIET